MLKIPAKTEDVTLTKTKRNRNSGMVLKYTKSQRGMLPKKKKETTTMMMIMMKYKNLNKKLILTT